MEYSSSEAQDYFQFSVNSWIWSTVNFFVNMCNVNNWPQPKYLHPSRSLLVYLNCVHSTISRDRTDLKPTGLRFVLEA